MKSNYLVILIVGFLSCSCNQAFLDIKPNKQTRVPVTLEDFRGLADDVNVFNNLSVHALGIIGGDEYYLTESRYLSLPAELNNIYQSRAYVWDHEIYNDHETHTDWGFGYAKVIQANVILEGLVKLASVSTDKKEWDRIYGSALFHRANAYYGLAQLYCNVYDPTTADADLGLPLRVNADPSLKIDRSSLKDTYALILDDLFEALDLLSPSPDLPTRPSKRAVYALLTRVYMQMGDYDTARDYARAGLDINDDLVDFNDLDRSSTEPFKKEGLGEPEMIFVNGALGLLVYGPTWANVDTILYGLYKPGDLRKQIYFRVSGSRVVLKGSYKGSGTPFTGYATNELYMNLSECLARTGHQLEAVDLINKLLEKRFVPGTRTSIVIPSDEDLLQLILEERKKELVFTGIRWEDMRRLNKEGKYPITVKRVLGDRVYELKPGDLAWTWPIPPQAIRIGGYQQNAR